jgi:hypothetical protein
MRQRQTLTPFTEQKFGTQTKELGAMAMNQGTEFFYE